jgi:hypothetical protein
MDCPKNQYRITLSSGIWVIPACIISCVFTLTPWYKQTSYVFLGRRTPRIEPLLKGNLCCSVTLSLQNQHPVHVQCFTVIFEAFWKCVTEFENSPVMEWGIQLSRFFVGRKITHGIELLLLFAPYLLTLYIYLSQVGKSQLLRGGSGL